jgi:hypothetical protein
MTVALIIATAQRFIGLSSGTKPTDATIQTAPARVGGIRPPQRVGGAPGPAPSPGGRGNSLDRHVCFRVYMPHENATDHGRLTAHRPASNGGGCSRDLLFDRQRQIHERIGRPSQHRTECHVGQLEEGVTIIGDGNDANYEQQTCLRANCRRTAWLCVSVPCCATPR